MTVEQAQALIARVVSDPDFVSRLEAAPPEQRRAILTEEGYGDVKLRHLSRALPESAGGELTDEEFAAVAGGATGTGTVSAVSLVGGSVSAAQIAFVTALLV